MIECTCEHWPDYGKGEQHHPVCPYSIFEQRQTDV